MPANKNDITAAPPHNTSAHFAEVIEQSQKKLTTIAYRMLGNFEDARDCVQDAYLRLWKSQAELQDAARTLPWLLRIVINRCIDQLRKRKISQFFGLKEHESLGFADRFDHSHDSATRDELQTILSTQVARLKPRQKATFLLRDVEGYSVSETASLLGCSENSVLTNLHLARKNLRTWLKPYLQD